MSNNLIAITYHKVSSIVNEDVCSLNKARLEAQSFHDRATTNYNPNSTGQPPPLPPVTAPANTNTYKPPNKRISTTEANHSLS